MPEFFQITIAPILPTLREESYDSASLLEFTSQDSRKTLDATTALPPMSKQQFKTSLLLQDWRSGNPDALGQILRDHLPWLCRKVRGQISPALRSKDDTMFFVQEAVLAFLQDAPRFHIENGKLFRALLYRILQNTLLEHYRFWRAKRRDLAREQPIPVDTVLNLESPHPSPCEQAIQREEEAWLRFAMEFLRPKQRRILLLRLYDKLPYDEIGRIVGSQTDAARMSFSRAVAKLTTIKDQLKSGQLRDVLGAETESRG